MALKDMIATKRHAAEKGSECQELPCYPVDVKGNERRVEKARLGTEVLQLQ
jgi:hypothetical protein